MKYTKRPNTAKFPFLYIATFEDGIAVNTTNENKFDRLKDCISGFLVNDTCRYFALPHETRARIELSFDVIKPRIF